MHQQPTRRSKRTVRRREPLDLSSDDSIDQPLPRATLQQATTYTLPVSIVPVASISLMTTSQRHIDTQTTHDTSNAQTFQSKSIPSFAETQLLSVYYLNRNAANQSSNHDDCIFVEQQERHPVRFRATYDPTASTKSTQTSPPPSLKHLSTYGSTLIVDANQQSTSTDNRLYEQRLKIYSGSQRLTNNPSLHNSHNDDFISPSELVEESRYSYEEYILHVDDNQQPILPKPPPSPSPTTTSSVTTIVAQPSSASPTLPLASPPVPPLRPPVPTRTMLQPEELDSDRTSRLSGDDINTHSTASSMSGSFTNQDWPSGTAPPSTSASASTVVNTQSTTRVSSWPPAPHEAPLTDGQLETSFILDDSEEQRRPTRVQFAKQLVRVIPASVTTSLSEESGPLTPTAPPIAPRTSASRTQPYEQEERDIPIDIDDDDDDETSTTTTTSSNREATPSRLQRTSGLTNLNEAMMSRPTVAPPPPPASAPANAGVDPNLVRDQLRRLDYQLVVDTRPPVNQSKWVKDHLDVGDTQPSSATNPGRVDALRSLFEQQSGRSSDSSTLNSPTGQIRRTEPEERPSRHGDEIRFRVKENQPPEVVHHADPIQVVPRTRQSVGTAAAIAPLTWEDLVGVQEEQQYKGPSRSLAPFDMDQVRQITGKRLKTLDSVGYYHPDGRTWQWDETFWFSLTAAQRDRLRRLLNASRSRQDSGDTQINESSDRSAYQGDSEDDTPKLVQLNRPLVPQRQHSSQENLSVASLNQNSQSQSPRLKLIVPDPGSTVSVTGAGAWQQQKQATISSGIGRYTETSAIHDSQPSVSVFGSTPMGTYTRVGSQESIASSSRQQAISNKKQDSQMTIIESGYSSADEPQQQQQRANQFRPNSSTIIEEPTASYHPDSHSGIAGLISSAGSILLSSQDVQLREQPIYENLRPELLQQIREPEIIDFSSYEQFVYEYLSSNARRLRSDDGTLVLLIDGQQIQMSHIRLPSNDHITLARNVYLDAIDEYPSPFETELDQLVIFIHGEPITLPADRWLSYKKKFIDAPWVRNLDRVNRRIPTELLPVIEQWLADHTTFQLNTNEMNVDGLTVPLLGKLGSHVIDLYQVRQLQSNESFFWSEILKYLIRSGYVSFDARNKMIHVAQSELDARRLLTSSASPSPELVERVGELLRSLDSIHFDNDNGRLLLGENFALANDDVRDLFEKYQEGQVLNANELASLLLRLCDIDEDQDGHSLVLSLDGQTLTLTPPAPPLPPPPPPPPDRDSTQFDEAARQWLSNNIQWSSEQGRVFLIRYRSMPNSLVRVSGPDGLRLSSLLEEQTLDFNDLLEWHEQHVQLDRAGDNSLRMIMKPNRNVEIVNLPLEENEKNREKVNEEKPRLTNEKKRSASEERRVVDEEEEEKKRNLVSSVPLRHRQVSSGNEEKKEAEGEEEKNHSYQHSTSSSLLERKEQEKLKSIDNDDDVGGKERALFLESIASVLHFVNANGSNVGTLELIQGRRLRLSLTGDTQLSQQQQHIEFDEHDTNVLYRDLQLDIDACARALLDRIFEKVEFGRDKDSLLVYYRGQMLKLKNLKQKFLQPAAKKLRLTGNKNGALGASTRKTVNEDDVDALTQWLEQLNRQQLITMTDQNDVVVLYGGDEDPEQQIFIKHEDVDVYMEEKINAAKPTDQAEVIVMMDIARILLAFDYVQYSAGQLTHGQQNIALDRNELDWLRSIIRGVRPNNQERETEVDLFDGEHTQVLRVPYEHMPATNNPRTVADYLFKNGTVRYDVDTGNYAYRYVPPDIPLDDDPTPTERLGQRQLLSSHIRQIHVDDANERIEVEFLHDPERRLLLPTRWFRQVADSRFDRAYIIDMLLANGGVVDHDTFTFNGRSYSLQVPRVSSGSTSNLAAGTNLQTLKLSSKQKQEVIERYVESISKQDGIKRDNSNNLLLLEDPTDSSQLYLTPEHTDVMEQNQFRRQDLVRLLNKHSQIKQDEFGNWLLHYNNQYIQFPAAIVPQTVQGKTSVLRSLGQRFSRQNPAEETDAQFRARLAQETREEFLERYHETIDYMHRRGLIVCNRRLRLVQIHFSNQTLTIPLEQLRAILNTRLLSSTSETVLPFESRQLSQWLLDNSDAISNTREGYIQLMYKDKPYDFPLINPGTRPNQTPMSLSAIIKRFGLTSKSMSFLTRTDLTTADMQVRCAHHLLAKIDQYSGINIDNDTRTLILSMTPDKQHQLIVQNPVLPVTKQTLVDYLVNHGRFVLNGDRTDIEYRHYDDGRMYRFGSFVRDWDDALGETDEERIVRVLGEILSLNGRFLQRADRQIIISLRNGERFIIPSHIGSQLIGPVNGETIAELLVKYADDIYEEQDGRFLVIQLADQTLRLQQQRQLMSSKQVSAATTGKTNNDPKLKLLFPFNKSLRQIQKTPSSSTLNIQPPDASNGYAIDPLLMLANYIYRAGSIYQDDLGRLVIKMNEDEIVVPRIEAINAIETINTSPQRTGTIVARLIDRIGKVQSNKAGGLIITIGKSSFELSKELIDRANQLHRETIDLENDIPIFDQDVVQTGLNGSMTLAGRHNRQMNGPALLPLLRQSKSVGSLSPSTIGHPWFTDDQQMLYAKDGRGDARYLNLDNYSLAWQKEAHKHGVDCEVRTIRNVAPYLSVLGYTENDGKKAVTISDLTRLHPEMLARGKLNDNLYLTQLENDRAQVQTSLCPKPRILVIPDDETMLASNRKTRFYVQYMYDHDAVLGADPAYVMMLPSRYPVRPTRPQLIAPHHYRDIALREAPVYVHKKGEGEVFYENLAQYLSAEHPDVSPRTVRRMLKFSSRKEYLEYLSNKMPTADAEQLVDESEEPLGEAPSHYVNVATRTGPSRINLSENDDDDIDDPFVENDMGRRFVPPRTYYNVPNGASNIYEEQRQPMVTARLRTNPPLQMPASGGSKSAERSPSTSSFGSDMLIANTLPARRAVLGNAPSSNIPLSRNDPTRASSNPLSSLTDENYGRPVTRRLL